MRCFLRNKYTYQSLKYNDLDELREFVKPIHASELETETIIHLVECEKPKPNLVIRKGDYLVITYENDKPVKYETLDETEYKNKYYDDFIADILEKDTNPIIHIEKDKTGNVLWVKRRPTEYERTRYCHIERDEKGIPLCYDEPYAILEYRDNIFPIYSDEYGQQDYIVIDDRIVGGGAYNFYAEYDFIKAIDDWFDSPEMIKESDDEC